MVWDTASFSSRRLGLSHVHPSMLKDAHTHEKRASALKGRSIHHANIYHRHQLSWLPQRGGTTPRPRRVNSPDDSSRG